MMCKKETGFSSGVTRVYIRLQNLYTPDPNRTFENKREWADNFPVQPLVSPPFLTFEARIR